jgi:cleavage stimulation factor subunit 3
MTEPPVSDPDADAEKPTELAAAAEADKTQPADEIENVLEHITPTVPNTQEELQQQRQPSPTTPTTKEEKSPAMPAPPRSEWQMLRDKLREHVFDSDGWNRLVELAENDGDMEQIKETYESLLEVYPNTVCPLPRLFTFSIGMKQVSLFSFFSFTFASNPTPFC